MSYTPTHARIAPEAVIVTHKANKRFVAVLAFLLVVMAAGTVNMIGASSWSPRAGCADTIIKGDTLTGFEREYGVPIAELVKNNPHITNRHEIDAGDPIDVCASDGNRGSVSLAYATVDAPDRLVDWASDVLDMQAHNPNITDDDVLFLTTVSLPESQGCDPRFMENRGDADPPKWGPSVGCVQIRTLLRNSDLAAEPLRRRTWLEADQRNVAEAAGWILYESWGGRQAWGPAKHAPGIGVKLPPNGDCSGAADVSQCEEWWELGRAAVTEAKLALNPLSPTETKELFLAELTKHDK